MGDSLRQLETASPMEFLGVGDRRLYGDKPKSLDEMVATGVSCLTKADVC